jgi:hypothetical protein
VVKGYHSALGRQGWRFDSSLPDWPEQQQKGEAMPVFLVKREELVRRVYTVEADTEQDAICAVEENDDMKVVEDYIDEILDVQNTQAQLC